MAIVLQRIKDGKGPLFMERKPAPEKPMNTVAGGKRKKSRTTERQRELDARLVNVVNAAATDKQIALAVALLLKQGANPNTQGLDGKRVLTKAILGGNAKTARMLINSGANVHARDNKNGGMTPLMIAAEKGLYDVCALLLQKGAKPNAKDAADMTALMWAAQENRLKVCRLLVRKGAKVSVGDKDGDVAVMYAPSLDGDTRLREFLEKELEKERKNKP